MVNKSGITIYDVADLAKVSMATVSRVLNYPDKVNTVTKERVLNAIDELGYVPNPIARDLALKKTTSVNIVVSDITCTHVPQIINGILNTADNLKCSLKISSVSKNKKMKEFINYFIAEKTRGVILINDAFNEDEVLLIEDAFKQNNIQLVILDIKIVTNDILAYDFGVNAMDYLLQKLFLG